MNPRKHFQARSRCLWLFVVGTGLLVGSACAAEPETPPSDSPVADLQTLERLVLSDETVPELQQRAFLQQTRNHQVMRQLVGSLPEEERPNRILYLASGSHMAPLTICEVLPAGRPCSLLYTELDPEVIRGIDSFLLVAQAKGLVAQLRTSTGEGPGYEDHGWRFTVAGRAVDLTLRVRPARQDEPSPLVQTADLEGVDLIVSHDLSGEPLGNLRLIFELVQKLRARSSEGPWPLLMIEDLEAHPYPVDLHFFSPRARVAGTYGHRDADEGPARHGAVELGAPVFGGAVLLGWDDPWLATVDDDSVRAVFDVLLFSAFDRERQNVLSGGDDPLLAPAILDWWTGFGARSIDGLEQPLNRMRKAMALTLAARARVAMGPQLAARMACHLALYQSLLQARLHEDDWRALLPAHHLKRRPVSGKFPSVEMERSYRDAMLHTRDYRAEIERQHEDDELLLKHLNTPELAAVIGECTCTGSAEHATERYRELMDCLRKK